MASLLGWIATIIFTLELIPQMYKTIKTKTVHGVSSWVATLYLLGNAVALFYAIFIDQPPLIVKYAIALPVAVASLVIYFYYKRKCV